MREGERERGRGKKTIVPSNKAEYVTRSQAKKIKTSGKNACNKINADTEQ